MQNHMVELLSLLLCSRLLQVQMALSGNPLYQILVSIPSGKGTVDIIT